MARKNITTTTEQAITNTNSETLASTRALRIDGTTVIADLDVRKSRDGEAVKFVAHIDFAGIPADQIMLWAARTKIIDLQRALRLCDLTFLRDLAKRGPIIRKATEAGTSFVDPEKTKQRIMSQVSNMTPEEKATLVKLLQASM